MLCIVYSARKEKTEVNNDRNRSRKDTMCPEFEKNSSLIAVKEIISRQRFIKQLKYNLGMKVHITCQRCNNGCC